MVCLASTTRSKASASMVKAAIRHFNGLHFPGQEDPTDNRIVRDVLKCVRKTFSMEIKKSNPISSEEVSKVALGLNLKNFKDLRTVAMLLLQFNLMGRFSDIQRICCGEVEFVEGGHLKVKIVTAKNYESYEAMTSYIVANQEAEVFSVGIIRKYLEFRDGAPTDFLFTNFRLNKKRMACLNTVVTYDSSLKCLRQALDRVGLRGKDFTLHSIKTGAFSEARNSGKVGLSVLRRHARYG